MSGGSTWVFGLHRSETPCVQHSPQVKARLPRIRLAAIVDWNFRVKTTCRCYNSCRRQPRTFTCVGPIQNPSSQASCAKSNCKENGRMKRVRCDRRCSIGSCLPFASITGQRTNVSSRCMSRQTRMLLRRPDAAIVLLPKSAVLFAAGAIAGAIGKTLTAPLDRVKILLQTQGGMATGNLRAAAAQGGLWRSFVAIGRQEGIKGYWRGNIPQVLRILPYSACQLYSYDFYKRLLGSGPDKTDISLPRRLAAGAAAGMTSTLLTYPLDTLRLRMAIDPSLVGMRGAVRVLMREGAGQAFFRGIGFACLGIAPYMAVELAAFDLLPREMTPFARGFSAALLATTCCYPLDTLRRQIQMQSAARVSALQVARSIYNAQGISGFYRGFLPNALKNMPNKGVRLGTYDAAKKMLAKSQAVYDCEMAKTPP